MCGGSQEISGKDSDPRSLPWTSGAWILERPMHGKVTPLHNQGTGVFGGLPEKFRVTRYHSLIVDKESVPSEWQVDAVAEDGAVMGISHKILPLYGVQFHPEAVLTEYGHEILENFCRIAENA